MPCKALEAGREIGLCGREKIVHIKVKLVYWCKCKNSLHPHKYIKKPNLHGRGKPKEYALECIETFCCDEMEKAYDENFIQFKTIFSVGFVLTPTSYNPIGCGLAIIRTRCFPECTSEENMYIDFCPFCGQKIEIEGLK